MERRRRAVGDRGVRGAVWLLLLVVIFFVSLFALNGGGGGLRSAEKETVEGKEGIRRVERLVLIVRV